jgi:hypothetical protein
VLENAIAINETGQNLVVGTFNGTLALALMTSPAQVPALAIANADADHSANEGAIVSLNGSASVDPQGRA